MQKRLRIARGMAASVIIEVRIHVASLSQKPFHRDGPIPERGGGVGRDLGVGVTRGPAVGVAVTVAVGVGVGAGKQKNSIELSGVPSLPYPPANHM